MNGFKLRDTKGFNVIPSRLPLSYGEERRKYLIYLAKLDVYGGADF
jgi:hypothetical protein